MSKYAQAADALKRYAVKYESLMAAAVELEALGSMDQAAKEAQAALQKAQTELVEVTAATVKAKADVAAANAEAIDIVATAADQAEAVAVDIRRRAEVDAADIIKAAQDEAGNTLAAATIEQSRLADESAGLRLSIATQTLELEMLQNECTRAEEDAKQSQARLDKVQAQIRKLAEV